MRMAAWETGVPLLPSSSVPGPDRATPARADDDDDVMGTGSGPLLEDDVRPGEGSPVCRSLAQRSLPWGPGVSVVLLGHRCYMSSVLRLGLTFLCILRHILQLSKL